MVSNEKDMTVAKMLCAMVKELDLNANYFSLTRFSGLTSILLHKSNSLRILPLEKGKNILKQVGKLIQQTFKDDPYYTWLLNSNFTREEIGWLYYHPFSTIDDHAKWAKNMSWNKDKYNLAQGELWELCDRWNTELYEKMLYKGYYERNNIETITVTIPIDDI
jgi:hypothetical protein